MSTTVDVRSWLELKGSLQEVKVVVGYSRLIDRWSELVKVPVTIRLFSLRICWEGSVSMDVQSLGTPARRSIAYTRHYMNER